MIWKVCSNMNLTILVFHQLNTLNWRVMSNKVVLISRKRYNKMELEVKDSKNRWKFYL